MILLRNKYIIAFAIVNPVLTMDSAVVYVLFLIILFHSDVFQESYNSLKMAQGRLKVIPYLVLPSGINSENLEYYRDKI